MINTQENAMRRNVLFHLKFRQFILLMFLSLCAMASIADCDTDAGRCSSKCMLDGITQGINGNAQRNLDSMQRCNASCDSEERMCRNQKREEQSRNVSPPESSSNAAGSSSNAVGSSDSSDTCRSTTDFLSDRLPPLGPPELEKVRQELLGNNIQNNMKEANRQGFTHADAVQAAFNQAKEYDRAAKEALGTATDTDAFGTTDEEFSRLLKNGSLSVSRCEGIRNNALCAAITFRMSALTFRAIASEMECHLRANSWPK
jgi:hypothetical protein